MGMRSAAEAKLDARIRPDITVLRARTSYPRRHPRPLAVVPGVSDPVASGPGPDRPVPRPVSWRPGVSARPVKSPECLAPAGQPPPEWLPFAESLAANSQPPGPPAAGPPTAKSLPLRSPAAGPPRAAPRLVAAPLGPHAPAQSAVLRKTEPASGRLRLTRRGRIVVGLLVASAVAAAAALIWLAVAGQAQAVSQVPAGGTGTHGMVRVVVRPGDSLWTIAATMDPGADPRLVIQQIVDDNSLSGTAVSAGQVLWVPRG